MTDTPNTDEIARFSIRAFRGIEAGLGTADPTVEISRKLEAKYPGHLILVQSGKFLHGFDRSAYALSTQASGHTVYVSEQGDSASILTAISPDLIREIIADLKQRGELNKAAAKQLLTTPDTAGFKLKSNAQDLDMQLLHDIIKMPRDLRCTYGENLRGCMNRILHAVFAFGLEENKPALLRNLSADVDMLKHYLTQAPRLSQLKSFNFEHRVGLAVELGRLVGGLIRAQQVQP